MTQKIPDSDPPFSADAFDLAVLGLMDMGQDEAQAQPEDDTPSIPPTHDMESLDFFLWMQEEVDKEQARRMAEKRKQP